MASGPLAGEERLQPQQVRGVPGGEDGQRAEQADPRPGRAGLARRPVQPGQRVGAGRGEHVLLAAEEPGDRGVVQVQPRDQAGIASASSAASSSARTTGGWALASRSCWASSMIVSSAVPLRGRGGGQVVVALDRRGVVRVDRRAGAAVPAGPVPQRQVGRPDPAPVHAQPVPGGPRCWVDDPGRGLPARPGRRSCSRATGCRAARRGRARGPGRSAPATAPAAARPGAAASATPPPSAP